MKYVLVQQLLLHIIKENMPFRLEVNNAQCEFRDFEYCPQISCQIRYHTWGHCFKHPKIALSVLK